MNIDIHAEIKKLLQMIYETTGVKVLTAEITWTNNLVHSEALFVRLDTKK